MITLPRGDPKKSEGQERRCPSTVPKHHIFVRLPRIVPLHNDDFCFLKETKCCEIWTFVITITNYFIQSCQEEKKNKLNLDLSVVLHADSFDRDRVDEFNVSTFQRDG